MVNVHDHFDGSYRCVECSGPCKLTGGDLLATQLVRMLLERYALSGWKELPMYETHTLSEHGIDVATLYRRAKESMRRATSNQRLA